jgi:D-tyrosyl-tRNA(Tyr) deacylase
MNLSAADVGAEMPVVSQFTLLADIRRGRRASCPVAAPPEKVEALYEFLISKCVKTLYAGCGSIRAMMEFELVNDGSVTLMVEDPPREP